MSHQTWIIFYRNHGLSLIMDKFTFAQTIYCCNKVLIGIVTFVSQWMCNLILPLHACFEVLHWYCKSITWYLLFCDKCLVMISIDYRFVISDKGFELFRLFKRALCSAVSSPAQRRDSPIFRIELPLSAWNSILPLVVLFTHTSTILLGVDLLITSYNYIVNYHCV